MSQFIRLMFKFSAETIFFCLFISFYCLSLFLSDYDLTLVSMPKMLIGESTIAGLDVSKRVALFYKSVSLFIIIFLLLNGAINRYRKRLEVAFFPVQYVTGISVLGILILTA